MRLWPICALSRLLYIRRRYAPEFRRVVAAVPLRVYHAGGRVRRGVLRLVLVDVGRGRRWRRRRLGQWRRRWWRRRVGRPRARAGRTDRRAATADRTDRAAAGRAAATAGRDAAADRDAATDRDAQTAAAAAARSGTAATAGRRRVVRTRLSTHAGRLPHAGQPIERRGLHPLDQAVQRLHGLQLGHHLVEQPVRP